MAALSNGRNVLACEASGYQCDMIQARIYKSEELLASEFPGYRRMRALWIDQRRSVDGRFIFLLCFPVFMFSFCILFRYVSAHSFDKRGRQG